LVPGLLQTEDYARTIITAENPDEEADEIECRVNLWITRQRLLTRAIEPPKLMVALNETVLRRPVGGNSAMTGQLRHLDEVAELPNVTIKVVPVAAGLHRGVMSGKFTILRFPRNGDGSETEPPTVYPDGYTGDLYLDKPTEVGRYEAVFEDIWNTALTGQATRRLLSEWWDVMNRIDLTDAHWFKSSHSNGQSSCVEVAFFTGDAVAVRDTKDKGQGCVLVFTANEWDAFINGACDGEFHHP
jgi:hypothetical protein